MLNPNETINDWLENLVYRQGLLWFGELACELIKHGNVDQSALSLNSKLLPARHLTNAAFESASVNTRAVLYFLGLEVDNQKQQFKPRKAKPRDSDVLIEEFGGTVLSVADFQAELTKVANNVTLKEAAICLIATNKTVAHLTRTGFPLPPIAPKDVQATCHTTRNLLTEALKKLGKTPPTFPNLAGYLPNSPTTPQP